jgi:DNA-binding response OmpR family regulator
VSAPSRILVVEDEESLALGIRDALEHSGFEVELAHDGLTGLDRAQNGRFDLVVLDLMLPGKSGMDLLRELRDSRDDVRVLILTAMSEEKDVLHGFEVGADETWRASRCTATARSTPN